MIQHRIGKTGVVGICPKRFVYHAEYDENGSCIIYVDCPYWPYWADEFLARQLVEDEGLCTYFEPQCNNESKWVIV